MNSLINFRDMGGRRSSDGRTVGFGRLYRSGELTGIPDSEKSGLTDYCIKHIIDLRSEYEARTAPDIELEGAEYHNILLHRSQDRPSVPPEEKEFRKLKEENLVIEYMTNVYKNLITSPFALSGFSQLLEILSENSSGAVLFHCFAGKDRTGVAAAIIYSLLGVGNADILEEYLLTNDLRKEKNNEILEKERLSGKSEKHLAALKVSYEVRPVYLNTVFDIAEKENGSLFEYLKDKMAVSDSNIRELRNNYLK